MRAVQFIQKPDLKARNAKGDNIVPTFSMLYIFIRKTHAIRKIHAIRALKPSESLHTKPGFLRAAWAPPSSVSAGCFRRRPVGGSASAPPRAKAWLRTQAPCNAPATLGGHYPQNQDSLSEC